MSLSPWNILALTFVLLLLLNIFIRVRVLGLYRKLVNHHVDFEPAHFFNPNRLNKEILPRYPEHKDDIVKFVGLVRFSMTMASIILVLIIIFGYLLLNS